MQYREILAACALAIAASAVALYVLIHAAPQLGLLDRPSGRKQHVGAVPQVGGLAVFLGLLVGIGIAESLNRFNLMLLVSAAALMMIGAIDDRWNLRVRMRVALQVLVIASMAYFSGVHIHTLGSLFGYTVDFGIFGIPFTVFAVIGLLNAFNLVDGIDGLAGGLALVGITTTLLASGVDPTSGIALILLLLGCALLPFLAANVGWLGTRHRSFLGDAGSTLLGYVLAWALIRFSQSGTTSLSPVGTLWCVAVPVLDVFAVMYRRMREGRNPFKPDRCHIHHLLLDAGLKPRTTVLLLLATAVCLWLIGETVNASRLGPGSNLLAFLVVAALYIAFRRRLYFQRRAAQIAATA